MESKRAVPTFNSVAAEIGELVTEKNQCYGDSFAKCGEFLRLLYPTGLEPSKYGDALSMVRIFDKQMRIATRKDAFGESPYFDIAGYGLLGATADAKAAMFHTPLAPEEVKAINEAISPPSLCGTCIRQGCPLDCADHTTECGEYLPQGIGSESAQSKQWTHAPEAVALSLDLPSITVEGDLKDVHEKYEEERREWGMCNAGTIEGDIEAWDVVQARQTYAERGGNVDVLTGGRPEYVLKVIAERYADAPEQVLAAKRAMIVKNAARAMYAPEVCLKIVMSGGKEW